MGRIKRTWAVAGDSALSSALAVNLGASMALRGFEAVLVDVSGSSLPGGLLRPGARADRGVSLRDTIVEGLTVLLPQELHSKGPGGGEGGLKALFGIAVKMGKGFVIADLGGASAPECLDLFNSSDAGIVVMEPGRDPVQKAFAFLKDAVYRGIENLFYDNIPISDLVRGATDRANPRCVKTFSDLCERIAMVDRASADLALSEIKRMRPRAVLAGVEADEDPKAADMLIGAAKTFLGLDVELLGIIHGVPPGVTGGPAVLDDSAGPLKKEIEAIASALIGGAEAPGKAPETGKEGGVTSVVPEQAQRAGAPPGPGPEVYLQEVFGMNDNVSHSGKVFHVQTEAQGGLNPVIETIVYHGGRVYFSKRSTWEDVRMEEGGDLRAFAGRQHRATMAAIRMNKIKVRD